MRLIEAQSHNTMSIDKLVLVLLQVVVINAFSQNLVPNNSFEDGQPQCGPTNFPDDYGIYATHWECPTNGTTDLFSTQLPQHCFSCMPGWYFPPYMGVRTGQQLPRTGNEFAGVFAYSHQHPEDWREYLQTQLLEPLEKGKTYCGEMYISLADRVQVAVDKMGMAFRTKRTRIYAFANVLQLKSKVIYPDVLQDSINWTQVRGNFVADSAYTHLLIGNFFHRDNLTKVVLQGKPKLYEDMSYYFVDDVSVIRIPDEIEFEGDKVICEGKSATIKVHWGWEDMEWNRLGSAEVISKENTITVTPNVTTRYVFKGSYCKKTVTDTFEVKVLPFVPPDLGKDTTICEATSILLSAQEQYEYYTWQNGSTQPHHNINAAGTYWVQVRNQDGCSGADTITIDILRKPVVELGSDQVVCDWGKFMGIGIEPKPEEFYEWSTGEINSFFMPTGQGKYWLSVTNRCGISSDTLRLYSFENVFIPNLITPNGDGKNEHFEIKGLPPGLYPQLEIFNRVGKRIATIDSYHSDWPSSQSSNDLPTGVYYYTISLKGCRSYKGWLHVLK